MLGQGFQHTLTLQTGCGEIEGSHCSVVGWSMVFGDVICKVSCSRLPVDGELALIDAVPEPVESHVDGLGPLLFHCSCEDAFGAFIVSLEWGGWLWVM